MGSPGHSPRRHITLVLCMVLHAFVHLYGSMLVPLYLLIRQDLGLTWVKGATLIVTAYGLVYNLMSYPAGILADRLNRKTLLGVGLIGNAAAMGLMWAMPQYAAVILLAMTAGLFGSVFHPAANAMVAGHYPKSPGMAIGLLGIGSGIGFFVGPQYSGWRADMTGLVSGWRMPCLELGLMGIVVGVIFLAVAKEVPHEHGRRAVALGPGIKRRMLGIAAVLGMRDFSGVATFTLVSLYLQKALGYTPKETGWIVGAMMLASVLASPIAVWFSPGRMRLPLLMGVLVLGGCTLACTPHVNSRWVLPLLMVFQVFHLGSYAMSEAALLERVSPAIRGRIIGLFLGLAGTAAACSPWLIGWWTDSMGERALSQEGFQLPFAALGLMMVTAAASAPMIARLGKMRHTAPEAYSPAAEAIG
jgi:MFS family permease